MRAPEEQSPRMEAVESGLAHVTGNLAAVIWEESPAHRPPVRSHSESHFPTR